MTECTAVSVRAKTEERGSAPIETTDRQLPGPVFPAANPAAGGALRGEDELVRRIKALGHAVPVGRTLDDLDDGILARVYTLSGRGVAHLYAEGGGIVLAMAGSTAGDRRRSVELLPKLPDRPLASRRVPGVLLEAGEGHYSEEYGWGLSRRDRPTTEAAADAAAERFRAARYYRPALPGAGLDAGAVRRGANPAPRALIAAALRIESGAALALLVLARFALGSLRQRLLRAGAPWDSEAERGRMADNAAHARRAFVGRRESGRNLVVRPVRELDAERDARRETHWTEDGRFRRHLERRHESGRAAYDTARALYVQLCPGLERKLLHLLRRDGPKLEAEFVARYRGLADGASHDLEGAVRGALRRLAEGGKARRVRSRRTGEVFVAATEPLDERDFRRGLNVLIRDGGFGIVTPWAGTDGVEPEGEEDDAILIERDAEDVFPDEMGREASLDRIADDGAQEEVEAVTA
jgi:hypothetical protein